jgi:hypothetical protein
MPNDDPRAEVRKLLADMKADGITVKVTLNAAGIEGPGTAAMRAIDEEARALGMTYGDES